MSTHSNTAKRTWRPFVLIVSLVAACAGAAGWAGGVVLQPAADPLVQTAFTTVSVGPGEVGSSLNLNTVAAWQPTTIGANQAAGIVTSVAVSAGTEVEQGDVLYTVDQRPVVIAQGEVPAFRPIGEGAEGTDVMQLQVLLKGLGFYNGTADGVARGATAQAIRAWQKSLKIDQSGSAELGDVIFVPMLPTRVTLDSSVISRGAAVSGGEQVIQGLSVAPAFTVPVTDAQAALISTGTPVAITAPDGTTWDAVTTDQRIDDQTQTVVVNLAGRNGGTICREACGLVPVTGESHFQSQVVTVPTVDGLVVPSAALVTDAAGEMAVIDASGTRISVTAVASARGMTVIEGVDSGTQVRVPATVN
ncbi:peptidoglycan-binding protein [Rathayibacter sp. AY1A7]|uniref:peptidoglycan-binding protein n=1 Tax=Rathayibacter sp. AY1A7 TaxID=2080524 RepID=UPI000CE71D57|nr:peptidoglycan-binding protein [Rathayibacter sp. AY1A7]PPF20849.1 peptidoglycan-binding protein [Rathayibacter sp. AY1A7]